MIRSIKYIVNTKYTRSGAVGKTQWAVGVTIWTADVADVAGTPYESLNGIRNRELIV